jgi:hypothetical protein
MEKVVPWKALIDLIEPHYSKTSSKGGRPLYPLVTMLHCRDCLFHLPFELIDQALANFARSSIPFALITPHHGRLLHQNLNVQPVGFRLLDLEKLPISLPKPLARIRDYRPGRDFPRYVCLWSREQIESTVKGFW